MASSDTASPGPQPDSLPESGQANRSDPAATARDRGGEATAHQIRATGTGLTPPAPSAARDENAPESAKAAASESSPEGRARRPSSGAAAVSAGSSLSAETVKGVIDALGRAAAGAEIGKALSSVIQRLSEQAQQPARLEQPEFRRAVAYAVHEFEKTAPPLAIAADARSELSRLALTMPGLKNERLQDLLKATPTVADLGVNESIRKTAAEVARLPHQDTPEILSRIEALEGRVRLARRVEPPQPQVAAPAAGPETASPPQATVLGTAPEPGRQKNGGPAHAKSPGRDEQNAPHAQILINSPGANALLSVMTAAFGRRELPPAAPWDGPPASLSDRHERFESRMAARREDQALQTAERSGQAALEALQSFNSGPGARILGRIQDAAKTTPGGLPAVLSEMREGGRFADLRQEFNAALVAEKGFKSAYDRAASALASYGEDRAGVEQILARRPASDRMQAAFQRLDSEVGQAASLLPGRRDGKSAVDELGEKAREAITKALDAVRSVFGAGPSAQSSARPSAGASMTM